MQEVVRECSQDITREDRGWQGEGKREVFAEPNQWVSATRWHFAKRSQIGFVFSTCRCELILHQFAEFFPLHTFSRQTGLGSLHQQPHLLGRPCARFRYGGGYGFL